MSKVYTADEMREFANYNDAAYARNPGMYSSAVSAALRQAADAMDREEKREKKYEYTHRYGDDVVAVNHTDDFKRCFVPMGAVMVRREVGEWEEVNE